MDWDFLVIGGGVAGLTAGAALTGLGTVTVWEAEKALGYHASGRSAAMFEESYGSAPVRALTTLSRAPYEAAGVLSDRGLFLVGLKGQEDAFAWDAAHMKLPMLDLDAARARVPLLSDDVTRIGVAEGARDVDTDRVLQDAARAIRAAGGVVETACAVTALAPQAGGWTVVSETLTVTARHVINAAGAWADHVAALADVTQIGLQPMRRSVARVAAPKETEVQDWPMLLGVAEQWYAKPDAGALIVSPADEDPMAPCDAFADDLRLAEGMEFFGQAISAPLTRPLATWGGLRSFAPDRSLAIGPSVRDGFWWHAAQGGYGFQTAPAAAQFLADQISGSVPELDRDMVAALDPGRLT